MKVCTKCGAQLEDWQIYCSECGERVPEPEVSEEDIFNSNEVKILQNKVEQLQAENMRLQDKIDTVKKGGGVKKLLVAIFCVALIITNIYFFNECQRYSEDSYAQNKRYNNMQSEYDTIKSEYDTIKSEYDNVKSEYDFYSQHAVVVSTNESNLYHRYNCEDFDNSSYWIYNIELAKYKNYSPCPICME